MVNRKLMTVILSIIFGLIIIGAISILPQTVFYPSNFKVLPSPHSIYGLGTDTTYVDKLGFTHKFTDYHQLKIRSALGVQLTTNQLINSNYSVAATSIILFTNVNGSTNDQIEVGAFKGDTALGSSVMPQGFIVNWINNEKHDVVLLGNVPKYVEISVDENGVVFITVDSDVRQYAHVSKQYVYNFGYSHLEEVYR